MGKIIVNGKALQENTVLEVVVSTADTHWARQSDGVRTDYYRNRDLLMAFGDAEVMGAVELAEAFRRNDQDFHDWSVEFFALRAGEALQWGREHGIVEPIGARPAHQWRLLRRELQFELIGADRRQRAVRIRGLHGNGDVEAAKLWKRELGRRARAGKKRIAQLRKFAGDNLSNICGHAEGWLLPDDLERFRIGQHRTFDATRELILDAFDGDIDLAEAERIQKILHREVHAAMRARREGRAFPPAPIPTRPPVVPAEDYAMLGELNL